MFRFTNTRAEARTIKKDERKELFYTRKKWFRTFLQLSLFLLCALEIVCAPKIISTTSIACPPPAHPLIPLILAVAQKTERKEKLCATFPLYFDGTKRCTTRQAKQVYKFRCNYVYHKISYRGKVDHCL